MKQGVSIYFSILPERKPIYRDKRYEFLVEGYTHGQYIRFIDMKHDQKSRKEVFDHHYKLMSNYFGWYAQYLFDKCTFWDEIIDQSFALDAVENIWTRNQKGLFVPKLKNFKVMREADSDGYYGHLQYHVTTGFCTKEEEEFANEVQREIEFSMFNSEVEDQNKKVIQECTNASSC